MTEKFGTVTAKAPKGDKRTLELPLAYAEAGLGIARGVCFKTGRRPKPGDWWRIYHIRSGMALPGYTPKTVKAGAARIKTVLIVDGFDWTRPERAIVKDKKLKQIATNWSTMNLLERFRS